MIHDIITRPILTEQTRSLELTGVYTFEVRTDASKTDIKKAFEKLYGQTPTSVRVARNHAKYKFGKKGLSRKRARIKKAYVRLEKPISNFAKIVSK